ncbi:hypothetical protein BCV69DRAFT_245263 [Microstroma glucosiphilum]|uniref:Emopamil-binding protein n=1 Tax=Pseudomicrostroma glucosiphilum TaxID=1684307 RepID=A0A316UEX8_9BASI|nr:hypothetical protein BCV69DRAFT_245263 [Pseudomicrostroma glucosiphilum]PWN22961.1 hypothetical protein BCV69DRAFT_245263 [Pseudomicrostroma glucosiphilum]
MEGKTRGVIHQPTAFVKFWLLVSSVIVIWDFSFIFLRRWSLTSQGGVLSALWPGYDLYEFVDLNYSAKYWLDNRGFPLAQSTLNVLEDILNFSYLYLVHQSDPAYRAVAPIVGFSGVLMTFSKTLLYFLCDYYCGWCESGHNDWSTWIFLYALPNGFWIICPGYLTLYFGREIAALLTAAAGIVDSPFAAEDVKAAQKSKKSK